MALKVLSLTHRLQLYCPHITHKSLQSLYLKINTTWKGILTNKVTNSSDSFRCEFFARLIIQYSEFLQLKSQIMIDYADFLDGSYSLSNFFKSGVSRSPLQLTFLHKINKVWSQVSAISARLICEPKYLWGLRLNVAVNMLEEHYLLMCLLSHLILAFKIVCQRFN